MIQGWNLIEVFNRPAMEKIPIIDRSTIARNWHARGSSCGVWIDHAGRKWKETTLEPDELFMVMSGELNWR